MKKYKKHIFICEHQRDTDSLKGSCGNKHFSDLKSRLNEVVRSKNFNNEIRINSAGCLGACKHGSVMVIYPQGIYYGHVNEADLDEILKKSIIKDEIIDRLVIKA